MIKKFDEFQINENEIAPVSAIAVNKTKNKNFDIVLDEYNSVFGEDNEFPASIYVMPDDSVEIRTLSDVDNMHGVISKLKGSVVRNADLHRDEWVIMLVND